MKVRKRQRFGDWVVIDSVAERVDKGHNRAVLCYDEIADEIAYVRIHHLLSGKSTKHLSRRGENSGGASTRYKYLSLPKHVYVWCDKFRVCVKRNPGGYVTLGYFKTVDEAKIFIRRNPDLLVL